MRGIHIKALLNNPLWLNGPPASGELLLKSDKIVLPMYPPEIRKTKSCNVTSEEQSFTEEYFLRYSSLGKLIRVTSYIIKFTNRSTIPTPYTTPHEITANVLPVEPSGLVIAVPVASKGATLSTKT
ncbi:hypothetical protein PGB90_006766 [Kerria lacca]